MPKGLRILRKRPHRDLPGLTIVLAVAKWPGPKHETYYSVDASDGQYSMGSKFISMGRREAVDFFISKGPENRWDEEDVGMAQAIIRHVESGEEMYKKKYPGGKIYGN